MSVNCYDVPKKHFAFPGRGIGLSLLIAVCSLFLTTCENPWMEQAFGLMTISFNTNGGSEVPSQKLLRGETITRPINPVKANSQFAGWYRDNGSFFHEWDFNTVPDGEMTLFAKWAGSGISLEPSVIDFGSLPFGYTDTDIIPQSIHITNVGDLPTGNLTFSLTGTNAGSFELSHNNADSLNPGDFAEFRIFPKTSLSRGTYIADVLVQGNPGIFATASVKFVVVMGDITDISIQTPPRLTYVHGDTLDLSGLVVTVHYGGASENVPFAEFEDLGITTDPENGITLIHSAHNGENVTVRRGGFTDTTTALTVDKFVVNNITFPTAAAITFGQRLADSYFIGESPLDNFAWQDSGTVPASAGTSSYPVVFTPNDIVNYDYDSVSGWNGATVVRDVSVVVNHIPITSAAVTVDAPVKGNTPQETTTNVTGTGIYNDSYTITWSPPISMFFLAETQYTASVTLTAEANYTFTGLTSATINTFAATITNNTGSAVTLSYTFQATADKEITNIVKKDDINKLIYIHGEQLDLTGLVLEVFYDNNTTSDITHEQFASNGITISLLDDVQYSDPRIPVSHGAVLIRSGSGIFNISFIHEIFGTPIDIEQLTINKKPLTILSASHTKTYDGTQDADGVTVELDTNGIVGTEVVSVGSVAAQYTSAAIGTKTLNITGVTLTGADADNYIVNTPINNVTVAGGITEAPGSATIIFSVAQIRDEAPFPDEEIILSKTNLGGNASTRTFTIENPEYFDIGSINWEISGAGTIYTGPAVTGETSSFTLNANDSRYNIEMTNTLILRVRVDGVLYQRNIVFTIVP